MALLCFYAATPKYIGHRPLILWRRRATTWAFFPQLLHLVIYRAARLQVCSQLSSRHQIVATSRLFKGKNYFEVQAFFFSFWNTVMIKQVKMKNMTFLHKLTKVFSSTKRMKIMPVICSQLPLENISYIIFNAFSSFTFFKSRSRNYCQ